MQTVRTTVLLGAGAAFELAPDGADWATTENITRSIINDLPTGYDVDSQKMYKITLLKDIYEHICNTYSPNALEPNAEGSAAKVHFEILFHIIEMLSTYSRSWAPNTHQSHKAPFAPFIQTTFHFNRDDLFLASRHMLKKIYDMIYTYDSRFSERKNDWYREFWSERRDAWDIFNLNYDTTIEQSLKKYEDGYEYLPDERMFMRFNAKKLLCNNENLSTVNHIHGCISFGPDRYKDINHDVYEYEYHDMYKWPTVEDAHNGWIGRSGSNEEAQNGQTIIQGPIITGLSKTEKTTCLPYDIYRQNLYNAIQRNRSLLIAGYSFGDKYINHIFYRMSQMHGDDKRIVLIDYWDIAGFMKDFYTDDELDPTDSDLNPWVFENFFYDDKSNGETLMFIKRIMHHDCDVWEHFDHLSLTEPMVSDNAQLMLLIGGMKYSLEHHKDAIYAFLKI